MLILFDVDGTVVDNNQLVPDSARRALAQANAIGHTQCCTLGVLCLKFMISCGTWVFPALLRLTVATWKIGEQVVVDNRIPAELVPQVSKYLEESGAPMCGSLPIKLMPPTAPGRYLALPRSRC